GGGHFDRRLRCGSRRTASQSGKPVGADEVALGEEGLRNHRGIRSRSKLAPGRNSPCRRGSAANSRYSLAQGDATEVRRESASIGGIIRNWRDGHRRSESTARQGTFLQ